MTTYVLGDLPLSEPVKTGRAVTLQGTGSGEVVYTNAIPEKPLLASPGGGQLSIGFLAPNTVRLRAMAMTIWRSNDAVWSTAVWGIKLTPADLDGNQYALCYTPVNSVIGWQAARIAASYRLAANTIYTCDLIWNASPLGYSQINYAGPEYQVFHAFSSSEGRI